MLTPIGVPVFTPFRSYHTTEVQFLQPLSSFLATLFWLAPDCIDIGKGSMGTEQGSTSSRFSPWEYASIRFSGYAVSGVGQVHSDDSRNA